MIERIICLCIGYICGLFQTGFIIGKLKGIDIREHGSGNAGTTNTLRTMGLKYGLMVLAGDCIKCGIAILIIRFIYGNNNDLFPLLAIYAATGAILGHNFPFYMNFKGGKGMAATAGFVIFGLGWKMTILGILVFFLTFAITHYVSLGSILVYCMLLISSIVFWKWDILKFTANGMPNCYIEYLVIMILLTIMVVVRHKDNIKRLASGTERKTYLRSKPEIDVDKDK